MAPGFIKSNLSHGSLCVGNYRVHGKVIQEKLSFVKTNEGRISGAALAGYLTESGLSGASSTTARRVLNKVFSEQVNFNSGFQSSIVIPDINNIVEKQEFTQLGAAPIEVTRFRGGQSKKKRIPSAGENKKSKTSTS